MLYEVEKLRPAYLILWKTDRLSRDKYDATIAKSRLRKCGVKIVYIAESMPEDEASQILMESLLEGVAASFIASLRKNVIRGMTYNAQNALYNGVKILGYIGKQNHRYEVDDETAPIVRRIFREYAAGKPLQKICNELNDAGMRTVRGNKFTVNSMHHILTNRSYIGEYKFGDVRIPDGMPRLIDDEVFLAVQAKLEANKRGGKGAIQKIHPEAAIKDYWLTGKLCCGLCGGAMQGVSGTSKTGSRYYYYSCQNSRKHVCELKRQRKDLLETIVMYLLDDLLRDPALRMLIAEACYEYHMSLNNDSDAFEESIKAKLKDVENKLANLLKALESGIFNSTTAERMNVLENEKSMLNDALIAEQNRKKYDLKLNDILRFLDGFIGDINDPDTRRNLLNGLIDKIYVYPDKLVITSFYSEDRRELPFDETKQLIESRRTIMSMMGDYIPAEASAKTHESPCGDLEASSGFFP